MCVRACVRACVRVRACVLVLRFCTGAPRRSDSEGWGTSNLPDAGNVTALSTTNSVAVGKKRAVIGTHDHLLGAAKLLLV